MSTNYAELLWCKLGGFTRGGVMPVQCCCNGSWSLGRFWVQWQEPTQQNSPATIWFQSGCPGISKAPYCSPSTDWWHYQWNSKVTMMFRQDKHSKHFAAARRFVFSPRTATWKADQLCKRAEEAYLPADTCFNLLQVVMRHSAVAFWQSASSSFTNWVCP